MKYFPIFVELDVIYKKERYSLEGVSGYSHSIYSLESENAKSTLEKQCTVIYMMKTIQNSL